MPTRSRGIRKPRILPEPPKDRSVLSVKEAAGLLHVGESTIRAAVKAGTIPHFRFGYRVLFKREVLMKIAVTMSEA